MIRRARPFLVAAFVVVTACGGKQHMPEAQLGGNESPAAFQRSIGLTLLRTGQPRRALPYLQRLARLETKRAEPLCFVARAYLDMQMWQQAQETLAKALLLEPNYPPTHALLGVLFDAQGDHSAAAVSHRRASALDPNNAAFRNNVGFSLYLDGRYEDATAAYAAALKLGSNLQRVHNNLGFAYGKLGKLDAASEHFRLGGTRAEAANNLGIVYEERGDLERAYEAFVVAVRETPDLMPARGNLERICERLGRPMPILEGSE